jgi:transitional endoplasmic reticulum ATPase
MPSRTRGKIRDDDGRPTLEGLTHVVEGLAKQARKRTEQEELRDTVLERLSELGSLSVSEEAIQYEGTRIVLPQVMEGNLDSALEYLKDVRDAEEEEMRFGRTYDYRPNDGYAAFQRAMNRVFGTSGVGKAVWTMFGKELPELISIPVGPGKTMQVPQGRVMFTPLNATFVLHPAMSASGIVFRLDVIGPKKYRRHIEGFMDVIADELKERSIYRGKAITADDPSPEFLDPYLVDAAKVVYAQDALTQLDANLWTVLDHADRLRSLRVPLKRAVLLSGEYGTGKTLTGSLTAQHAVEAGWTFVLVKPGEDPYAALRTAALYAPAVVWIEDLDVLAQNKDRGELGRLLDALDGVSVKGTEVIAGFTTNFPESIDKAVLRPGRIDALIHIAGLDRPGFEALVRSRIPEGLLDGSVNFDLVAESMHDYVPAFAVEAAERALRYSMSRNEGVPGVISTQDLVDAADGLRPQYDLMKDASEAGYTKPTVEAIIASTVHRKLRQFAVEDVGPLVAIDGKEE